MSLYMFTSFAENIDKRIEDLIEKKVVKVEKVEKNTNNEENNDEK